jgi:hypothetical protein
MADWEKLDQQHADLMGYEAIGETRHGDGPWKPIYRKPHPSRTYSSIAEWEVGTSDISPEPNKIMFGHVITEPDENGHVEIKPCPYRLMQQIPGPDGRAFRVVEIEDVHLRSGSSVVMLGRVTCASRSANKATFNVGYVHTGHPREYTVAELVGMAGSGSLGGSLAPNPMGSAAGVRVQNLTKNEPEPKRSDSPVKLKLYSYLPDINTYNEISVKDAKMGEPPNAFVYKGKLYSQHKKDSDVVEYREVPNWEDM